MEVILLERVGKLGTMGDVVKVRDGFARNFLIPQKKALRATENNKKDFEARKSTIAAHNNELKKVAEAASKKFVGANVILVRQASEDGKLYGSVVTRDIAQQLTEMKLPIDRKFIELTTSIKNTGTFTAKIVLHSEVVVPITVNVVRNESDVEAASAVSAEALLETPVEADEDNAA